MTHDTPTDGAGTGPASGGTEAADTVADSATDERTDTAANSATDEKVDTAADSATDDGATNGADDAFECAYCGRLFAKQDWLALHRGIEHEDRLDDAERDAYEEAYAAENEELRLFRLKALAALVLLYFSFVMAYAVFA